MENTEKQEAAAQAEERKEQSAGIRKLGATNRWVTSRTKAKPAQRRMPQHQRGKV